VLSTSKRKTTLCIAISHIPFLLFEACRNSMHSTSKTWSLEAGQGSMTLPVKIAIRFGVLEYWSVGVLAKAKSEFQSELVFFITPLLHHSITPVDCRKGERVWKPPQEAAQIRVLRVRIHYFPLNFIAAARSTSQSSLP
jgi:hypothetical protein